MKRTLFPILLASMLGPVILMAASKPVSDPLQVELSNPYSDVDSDSDPRASYYRHGEYGVHAALPGTGNIVLDPDRYARGNEAPRWIELDLSVVPEGYTPATYKAYFLSVNSVGYACNGDSDSRPARDLTAGDCIQSELAINGIESTEWLLLCGGLVAEDYPELGLTNVEVTCVGADADGCTEWDLTSEAAGSTCALFEYRGGKKGVSLVPVSDAFPLQFAAHVLHQRAW